MRFRLASAAYAIVLGISCICGCARPSSPATSSTTAATVTKAASSATFALPVEPNGLWWDAPSATLYFASDDEHALYRWKDGRFTIAAALPAAAGRTGLGQLVRTPDGSTFITRFGHGADGGILIVGSDGVAKLADGLDGTRRRIGIAGDDSGALFDGYFVYDGDKHVARGGVARLSIDGRGHAAESEIIGGLVKPVGVLVVGDAIYVSDQEANTIVRATLSAPADARPFAQLTAPDLLCAGDAGAIFAAGKAGDVFRVGSDGHVTSIVAGLRPLRGIAFDAAGKRLFFVERRGKEPNMPPTLHVLQLQ